MLTPIISWSLKFGKSRLPIIYRLFLYNQWSVNLDITQSIAGSWWKTYDLSFSLSLSLSLDREIVMTPEEQPNPAIEVSRADVFQTDCSLTERVLPRIRIKYTSSKDKLWHYTGKRNTFITRKRLAVIFVKSNAEKKFLRHIVKKSLISGRLTSSPKFCLLSLIHTTSIRQIVRQHLMIFVKNWQSTLIYKMSLGQMWSFTSFFQDIWLPRKLQHYSYSRIFSLFIKDVFNSSS